MASPRIPQYYVILYYIMLYYIVRRNARGSSSIFSKVKNFLLGLALTFFPTPIIIICERGLRINILCINRKIAINVDTTTFVIAYILNFPKTEGVEIEVLYSTLPSILPY